MTKVMLSLEYKRLKINYGDFTIVLSSCLEQIKYKFIAA